MKQAKLLTDVEFKRLTATINSLRYATRNHTIVALSFYGGLRAVEISNILVKDIVDEFGEVKDTAYLSAQQTKGADGCTVYINEKLRKQIKKYITAYPTLLTNRNRKLIFSAKVIVFTAQTIVNCFNACTNFQQLKVQVVTVEEGNLYLLSQIRELTHVLYNS